MTIFRTTTGFVAAVLLSSASANADPITLDTVENVTTAMQACLVITSNHNYEAEGQEGEIEWNSTSGTYANSVGLPNAPVTIFGSVSDMGRASNSSCTFAFTEEAFMQETFDYFMQDRETVSFQDYVNGGEKSGVCFENQFISVEAGGADSAVAIEFGRQGHITITASPLFSSNQCTE